MYRSLLLLTAALIAFTIACSGGEDPDPTPTREPRVTSTPRAAPDTVSQLTSVLDLRTGMCFRSPPDTQAVREVEVVPCSGRAEYRVVGRFNVSADGDYPGTSYFDTQAGILCPPTTTVSIAPGETTWAEGDRAILCVQER